MTIELTAIIIMGEALLASLLVILFLKKRGDRLKSENQDLKDEIEKLRGELFKTEFPEDPESVTEPPPPPEIEVAIPEPPPPPPPSKSFEDFIDDEIELTRDFYSGLEDGVEIALDLDPDAPNERRSVALRHAILIAEKEAASFGDREMSWEFLISRYQQIIDFQQEFRHKDEEPEEVQEESPIAETPAFDMDTSIEDETIEDFDPVSDSATFVVNAEEIIAAQSDATVELLRQDLEQARKRISNLEKFKTLYFELEAKWDETRDEAAVHYEELKNIAAQGDMPNDLGDLIENYHMSYQSLGDVIINRVEGDDVLLSTEQTLTELRRLRNMATEQHRIIEDLQSQLDNERDGNEKVKIIENLKTEFKKQSRLLEESDTCIKLLEEELNSALSELDSIKGKLRLMAQLQEAIKDLEYRDTKNQHAIQALKQDNRKLAEQLRSSSGAGNDPAGNVNNAKLELAAAKAIKELKVMEAKYADLEEKYLDLKLQS